jgi:hypothetical protein
MLLLIIDSERIAAIAVTFVLIEDIVLLLQPGFRSAAPRAPTQSRTGGGRLAPHLASTVPDRYASATNLNPWLIEQNQRVARSAAHAAACAGLEASATGQSLPGSRSARQELPCRQAGFAGPSGPFARRNPAARGDIAVDPLTLLCHIARASRMAAARIATADGDPDGRRKRKSSLHVAPRRTASGWTRAEPLTGRHILPGP